MTEKRMTRSDLKANDCWNIESIYEDAAAWEKDLNEAIAKAEAFSEKKGHLTESGAALADALEEQSAFEQILERVYVYAKMKLDEDTRVNESQGLYGKVIQGASRVSSLTSFLMPELTACPEEKLLQFLEEEPRLAVYEHLIRDIIREKEHVLSDKEEQMLAELGEVLRAPDDLFTMLNDADMSFGNVKDEEGKEVPLTHGNYVRFLRSHDRSVRTLAYRTMYEKYKSLINTLASNYAVNVKTDAILARLRGYQSSRQAALSGGNIPETVYDNLITAVHDHLPDLHRYLEIRKKLLGLDKMGMQDVYVPLVEAPRRYIPFEEAVETALDALTPLGESYKADFRKGIDSRWIDRYETEGKASGAYSFGAYDTAPFILMNYTGEFEDVFTLIHEMGHSMNSLYTRAAQPFIYGDHAIFTAEVASTVNETLLIRRLLEKESDKDLRLYLLNMYLEAFRTTLFRQTMFAEFEEIAHKGFENGETLTAEWLSGQYAELNKLYFGEAVEQDELISYEWARIPHFYRSYYVYQYATGYSAANAIVNRILQEGEPAREDYLIFLHSGTEDYPVEILKTAGVDMAAPEAVSSALDTFGKLVKELEDMLN